MYILIPRVQKMRPNNLRKFEMELFSSQYVCVQLDQRPKRNNKIIWLYLPKKLFLNILIICGMTFEFEYLGEFKFMFGNKPFLRIENPTGAKSCYNQIIHVAFTINPGTRLREKSAKPFTAHLSSLASDRSRRTHLQLPL
jgi:hypothetical protein